MIRWLRPRGWPALVVAILPAFPAAEGISPLAVLMSNSSKGLTDGDSHVVTRVRQVRQGEQPALEIIEEYRSGKNDDLAMMEKRTLPLHAIHSVAIQRAGSRGGDAREYYIIITYRTGNGSAEVYQYRSRDSPVFGSLKSFRLGVYRRSDARNILALLRPPDAPTTEPPP